MILLCDVIVKYSFHRYSLCELLSAIDGKLCQHPEETGRRQGYTEITGISEDYEKCNMFNRPLQMELYDNFMNATGKSMSASHEHCGIEIPLRQACLKATVCMFVYAFLFF